MTDRLESHPIADSYPQLPDSEYQALMGSIYRNGLIEPIVLFEGKILDGRHRYNAVMDLIENGEQIEPLYEEFTGTWQQAEERAEDLNFHRRHLVFEQRGYKAALWKKSMGERRGRPGKGGEIATFEKTREIASAKYGVGIKAVDEFYSILESDPDLFEYFNSQEPCPEADFKPLKLREAQRIAKRRRKEEARVVSLGIEEVIVGQEAVEERPVVNEGEWWQLGRHTLYCGDSSSEEFYCSIEDAAFAFADPPYNAEVAEWDKGFLWRHDWLIDKAKVVAVTPGIVSIFDFARITTMPYLWAASCYIKNGMTRGAMGFGNWIFTALFSRGSLYRNSQDVNEVTINVSETDETDHKGRKPSGLLLWLIDKFTKEDDVVIDPFLGSGTTLYAAEVTNRKCVGAELDPQYCADIILRWQRMSGEKASLVHGKN